MSNAFLNELEERFLRYVKIDTTARSRQPIRAQPSIGRMQFKIA